MAELVVVAVTFWRYPVFISVKLLAALSDFSRVISVFLVKCRIVPSNVYCLSNTLMTILIIFPQNKTHI
jgi:hypothetical protein